MTIQDPKEIKRLEKRIRKQKWLKTEAGKKYLMRHRAVLERKVVGLLRKPDGRQWRIISTTRVMI